MENVSFEALVELVTKEVLKSLESADCNTFDSKGKPLALLIGSKDDLPAFAQEKYSFDTIDSYNGDISCYECVFVCELTCAELADCALGRDCRAVPCAVIKALLGGKKVYLLESALPHRKYRETADRAFYSMLEGYVNSLRSFGVELIRQQWYGKNLNKDAIADNSVDKVITEQLAITLCEKTQGDLIRLKKGTVITPSAKDIFNHSQFKVEFVD
ncbi:MAG: hypothetical protein IJZ57_07295 [Clostridia bacterium]|nr:hypothetical protein [Clostridia bacterium]